MRRCAVGLQLRVWRRSACFPSCRVALFRYRSFAFTARLVMRCGSDCPVPCDLSWLLDCLGSSVARFLLKRFNGFDVPVSRSSESHPSFRAICLRLALRSVLRPALRLAFLSSVRPVLPRDDVIDALPDRSPCCSACGHQSPRPACRGAGGGTGRAFLVIACPPCRRCLLALGVWRLRLFRLRRSALLARSAGRFVSVICWRNYIYDLPRCYNIM